MSTIAVINSKGGVGKTTVCVHLGHALALAGKRTLIVDMDMQDNVRIWLAADQKDVTLFEVLVEGRRINDAVVNVRPGLDIIPSGGDNLGAVPFLLSLGNMVDGLSSTDATTFKKILNKLGMQGIGELKAPAPEILKYAIQFISKLYDYILIDCSPSRTLLHTMAVVASDYVMVPVSMEWLSVVGSAQVGSAILEVKSKYKLNTEISWVVPTFVDRRRSRVCDEVIDDLKEMYKTKVTNPIRINGRLSEAPGWGKTVFDLGDQRGIEDFKELAEKVIGIEY